MSPRSFCLLILVLIIAAFCDGMGIMAALVNDDEFVVVVGAVGAVTIIVLARLSFDMVDWNAKP